MGRDVRTRKRGRVLGHLNGDVRLGAMAATPCTHHDFEKARGAGLSSLCRNRRGGGGGAESGAPDADSVVNPTARCWALNASARWQLNTAHAKACPRFQPADIGHMKATSHEPDRSF